MNSLRYRSDIDGLRAVAVLGVVIYHAFPQNLAGGFSGVDIFFVISGYLISGILYKGHREGGFSFREFYVRRIRRLFPALIVMLGLSLAYGWLVLLPDEFEQMGRHIAAGTLFIQNFVFWGESGYFDTAANLKPMLHLWSLAVEEQFYIIFPLVLIVLWKRPKILLPTMVLLMAGSFIANLVMAVQARESDFFLTPYRAWEFLGGALLAWWHYEKGHEKDIPWHHEVLSVGGALLLVLGLTAVHRSDPYPGWRALMPVGGTVMMIAAGGGAWINRRILSHPLMVWIGLISYPLYLFHWPILSFLHIIKGEKPGDGYLAGALVLSFLLAAGTYYFVEKRIRYAKWPLLTPTLITLFATIGVLGIASAKGWITARKVPACIAPIRMASADLTMMGDFEFLDAPGMVFCKVGGQGPQTLFFGDSNMQQYGPRISRLLKDGNGMDRGAIFVTAPGVLPIPGVREEGKYHASTVVKKVEELLASDLRIDRVVLAVRWGLYFDNGRSDSINGHALSTQEGRQLAMSGLEKFLQTMASGHKVTIVLPVPDGEELAPKNLYHRGFGGSWSKGQEELRRQDFLRRHDDLHDEIQRVAKDAGVEVIDPLDWLCRDDICITLDESGTPIRCDAGHLRPGYVKDRVIYLDGMVKP